MILFKKNKNHRYVTYQMAYSPCQVVLDAPKLIRKWRQAEQILVNMLGDTTNSTVIKKFSIEETINGFDVVELLTSNFCLMYGEKPLITRLACTFTNFMYTLGIDHVTISYRSKLDFETVFRF
jgi:hypothetical protein